MGSSTEVEQEDCYGRVAGVALYGILRYQYDYRNWSIAVSRERNRDIAVWEECSSIADCCISRVSEMEDCCIKSGLA